MSWLSQTATWYLHVTILGLIFFPIVARIFRIFPDRGYPFAKTVGIIIWSYTMLLLGITKILPFTKEAIILVGVVYILLILKFFKKEIGELKNLSLKQYILLGVEELLFIVSLLFLTLIRAQEPSIHGLEKFMDFGFMQSILKSQFFPPLDMWLSGDATHPQGYAINYYYFGHLTGAFLIKLTGINPFVGYNLILATIFAQGMTLSFSLVGSLAHIMRVVRKKAESISLLTTVGVGLLGAFIVNLAGNLHTIYIFTTGYPNDNPIAFWTRFQSFSDITNTMTSQNMSFITSLVHNSNYWYPNATRFIPFTIHEFPAYSYVVADLHGHVFDIPFVLLTFALIVLFILDTTRESVHNKTDKLHRFWVHISSFIGKVASLLPFRQHLVRSFQMTGRERIWIILIGGMIGINYMTNAFDGPIYLLLMVFVLFFVYRLSGKLVIGLALLLGSFLIFSFPFSHYFEPFATGVGVNCAPSFLTDIKKFGPFLFEGGNCQISEPWMMMVLWGYFWISGGLYIGYLFMRKKESYSFTPVDWIILLIYGYGTLLLIIPEFVYAKDIYPGHFRANTMFKLGYQAFMMMGIATTLTAYTLFRWKSKRKYIFIPIFLIIFFLTSIYPFLAFPSYYPGLFQRKTYMKDQNLNGLTWLAQQYPQDYEIIEYINANIDNQPVILEAQGDSYTDYNRISAFTGNPTVAGWWVHQWLWRGSSDVVGSRIPDIEALYQSTDLALTTQLIDKYHIRYVVISGMERDKYSQIYEEKFSQLGHKIFESKNGFGALYEVF